MPFSPPIASEGTARKMPRVLLSCPGAWHLPHAAQAFAAKDALAGLWISNRRSPAIPEDKYRRAWPFHAAMTPFYRLTSEITIERAFYALFPIWKAWFNSQSPPDCNVMHSIVGFATEPFDLAEKIGALKVADCPNSHPVTYHGFWQRECDLWCPGERVPVPRWILSRMNRELDRADLIIVQSNFCKESMILNGIPADKVLVNPMGVDTSIFKPRTVVPAKPRFVMVGALSLRKGHPYLFRAFQIVKQKLPAAELICIGNYKHDFRLERPKWEGSFTHYSGLSPKQVAEILGTCTAMIFPSQEEGIARAQIEALACGLPLAGTHEGGATTLVEDGVEGFIIRGRDPANIADAMLKLAQNGELNRRMGEAAARKGAIRNTWQDYGDRLLAEYQRRLTT